MVEVCFFVRNGLKYLGVHGYERTKMSNDQNQMQSEPNRVLQIRLVGRTAIFGGHLTA